MNNNRQYTPEEAYEMMLKEASSQTPGNVNTQEQSYTPEEAYNMMLMEQQNGNVPGAVPTVNDEVKKPGLLGAIGRNPIGAPVMAAGSSFVDALTEGATGGQRTILDYLSRKIIPDAEDTGMIAGARRAYGNSLQNYNPFALASKVKNAIVQPMQEALPQQQYDPEKGWTQMLTPVNVASGLGSMAGFMVPGAAVGKGINALYMGKNALSNPRLLKTITATAGGIMEGTSEAARVYTDTLARSNNEDEAIAGAAKTLAINVPLDVVTNYFGLVADNKLAKSLLKTTFLKATMGKVSEKVINAAVDILAQAGSGGVSEFSQETAQSLTSKKYSEGKTWGQVLSPSSVLETAITEGVPGGLVGALTGGAFGAYDGKKQQLKGNPAPQITPETTQAQPELQAKQPSVETIVNNTMATFNELRRIKPKDMTDADREDFPIYRAAAEAFTANDIEGGIRILREAGAKFEADETEGSSPMPARHLAAPMVPVDQNAAPQTNEGRRSALDMAVTDYKRLKGQDPNTMGEADKRTWQALQYAVDLYNKGEFDAVNNIIGKIYGNNTFDAGQTAQTPIEGRQFVNTSIMPYTQPQTKAGNETAQKTTTPVPDTTGQEQMATAQNNGIMDMLTPSMPGTQTETQKPDMEQAQKPAPTIETQIQDKPRGQFDFLPEGVVPTPITNEMIADMENKLNQDKAPEKQPVASNNVNPGDRYSDRNGRTFTVKSVNGDKVEIQDETYGSTGTLDHSTFSKLYTHIDQKPITPAIEETPEATVGNTPNTAEQGQPPQASEPTTTTPAGKNLTSPTPQQRAAVGKWYVKQGNGSGDPQYQRNGYYVDGEGRKVFNNKNQSMLRINDLDGETSDTSFGKYDRDDVIAKRHAGAFDRIKQSNSISLPFNSNLIEALQKTQAFKNDNIIKSPYQVTKVGNSYYNTEYLRDAIVALGGINEVSLKVDPELTQGDTLRLESKHGDAIIGSLLLSEYERVDLDKFYGKDIARNTPKSTPGATTTNEVEKEDNLTEGNKDVPKNELNRPVQDGTAEQNQGNDPQKEEKYPVGFTYQDTNYAGDTINKKVVGRSEAGEYYVQEEGRGGADIFAPDRMEQELKYAPDRIKRAQADKIQKQKDDEAKAKAAEDKKEYERLNQFADDMTPMQRGRVNAALNKQFKYDGKVMSRREFIEEAVKGHKAYVKTYEGDKGNEYALYKDKDARYYSQITKTEYDYFNYLTDSGTFTTTEMLAEWRKNQDNTLDKSEDNNIIRQDNNTNDTKAGEDSGNVSGSNSTGNDESLEDVLPEGVGESGLPGNTHGSVQTGRKDPKRNGQNQENSTGNERPGSVDRNDGAVLHNPVSPGNTDNIEGTQSDTGRDQADERRGETGEPHTELEITDNPSELENTATIADGEDDIKGGTKPSGIAGENPGNFVITEDLGLGEGTDGDKIKLNLQALRTLMQLRKDKRYPTKEEQAAMARYVGWGGLARVFDSKESETNNMYGKAQRELKEILTKDEFNTARSTVTDAHYTSKGVVDAMWRIVRHLGFNGGRALEPTVGIGNFIGLQPTELNAMTKWYASEIDTVSGEMASYLYPDATVLHSTGFQDAPFANGVFDLAIGNPPFGAMTLTSKGKKYKELAGMKIHNFIIAKTGEHLRPGGVMSMVVTHRFLDTANAEARDYLADRFKFIGALRLPNDAFAKNAGTEVVTDIIILQKLNIGEKADKNASWLDVNGSIDVNGEKIRVNKYFEEHPNHILGRSAMDGSMYARSGKAGTEYTVHSDGRDVGKSIDSIIASDFADFAGILKPTKADQNFAAAMVNQSTLAINGMMLDENGKIMRREEDDDNGNAVVAEITPDTIWSEDGYRWKYLIDQLADIKIAAKRKTFNMDMWSQFDGEAKAFYKADGSRKSSPNKAEESVYKINAAMASEQEKFVWKYDADLAEINQALERNILNEKRYNKLRGLLDLRNRVLALNNAEMSDAKNIEQLRKELNKVYDSFVKRFGFVSDPATLKLLGWDIGAEAGLENDFKRGVSATSAKNKGTVQRPPTANKADILSRRINYPVKEITHADSSLDALKISLSERGRADIAYMAKLTGQQAEDIIKDLSQGEHPQIFMDPEINDYVHADEYLSGNVKKKLDDAKVSNGLEANVKALEAVQPKPKKQEQITPNIRASWIPSSIFEEFLSALGIAAPRVLISRTTGKIIARARFSMTDDVLTDFGMQFNNQHHDVVSIFNAATAGKTLNVYVEDEQGNRTVAAEPTKVVNGLVDRMGQVFERWAYSSDSKAKKIVDAFNEEMNTFVPRKYDGVHYLKPVGVSPSISLRNTQKDAAWRMIQAPTVLLDHVVGAGKTFTIITGVMERKRLGLSKKPLIVVPNHLITQWAKSFYELYPNAKILAASPDDFTRKRRRALFARIATSDYDAIVIGHSSMGFIAAPAADQKLVIDEQIELLKDAMEEAKDAGNHRSVKDMEKRLKKLQDKLANLAARTTDDIGYDLETMGIDYVAVDESHEFKNLAYTTAAPRVVGMNDPVGSKKAFDLNIKVRGVLSRKGSVTFATGTPVSNSLVELYTVMQYLAHDELAERNQLNFDAWAGAYTRVETKIEYTPTQKVKPRRVLASVNNLSALRQLYDHFADIITMADIKRLYKEEIEAKNKDNGTHERTEFPVPKVKSGGRILDTGTIGETQSEYMDYAVARMNAMERLHGADKKAYATIDNALWVMNDVRQMSLDIRTIDPSLPREDNSKVNRAADNIKKIYDQWNEQRGTQLVFCDLSTPSKNAAKNAKKIIAESTEKLFPDKYRKKRFVDSISYMSYRDQWTKILDAYTEKMESDALSEDEADALSEYFDAIDEDASTSMIVADSGFSVYDDLKKVLEQKGIPSNEIAFIHDYDTPTKKSELFDRMNDGYVRVLIGSSAKMGAGMNAQERLVALHHMDPPWRPSDMWQREGRIIRQGNKLYEADPDGFEVSIIAYSTSGTSDTVMWQILQRKANAIEQFRQGEDIDTIEEESSDADQYADFMATSTGNPVFKKKVEAERKLDLIESEIGGVLLSRQGAAEFLKEYPSSKRKLEDTIAKLNSKTIDTTDVAAYKELEHRVASEAAAARGRYLTQKAEVQEAIAKWEKSDAKTRGKKPTMPVPPERADILHPDMQKASQYARSIKDWMDNKTSINTEVGASVSIPLGSNSTAQLTISREKYWASDKDPQWTAKITYGNNKGNGNVYYADAVLISKNYAYDPLDAYTFIASLSLTNVVNEYNDAKARNARYLKELNEQYVRSKEILAQEINTDTLDEAKSIKEWYAMQVKFAEREADIKRSGRRNRFIENERKGRKVKQSQVKALDPETIEVDGETYTTSGISYDNSHIQDALKATRDKDNLPVVILKTTDMRKQDKASGDVIVDYHVIEQPKSLKGESYSLEDRTNVLKDLPRVTAATISGSVPGAQVSETKNGLIKVRFKNGFTMFVDPASEELAIDPEIVKRDYGRDVSAEDIAVGRNYVTSGMGFVDLVAGMTDVESFDHEYYEVARKMAVPAEDLAILEQDFKQTEDESRAFSDFMKDRRGKLTKRSSQIFQKIKDFFAKIRAKLFGRRSEDIFRDIATGAVWNRKGSKNTAPRIGRTAASESYLVKQEISSAKTARPGQIPRGFKLIKWNPGTVNFDIGGGSDNEGTEYLKGQGVDSFVYDLYNRDPAHNRKSVERIIEHKVDTVTVMNVLNVIKEPEIRDNTILQAAKSLKKGGVAYFQIYEGSGDGVGKVTSAGWQNNMKTVDYVEEIQKRFNDVVRHGQIIEGRDPKPFKDKATWILDGDKAQETISYRIIRPSEAKKEQQKADPAEKVKYEAPVYTKDVSAKGRTKQEQTAWAQIADDLGLERVVEKRSPHLSLKERVVKAKHYIEDQWFNQEAPIRRYLGQDIFMMTRNAFDGVDSRAQALIEFGEKAEGIKSLKEIFKPVKGSKSEQQGFMHYAVYKHYVDIAQRSEDAEFAVHVLEQQAKEEDANARQLRKDMPFDPKDKKELESAARGCERYADELRAKANAERTKIKNSKADASKYQAAVDKLEKQYPEWKGMQKDLAKFNNYILKKYADAGIIPQSLYEYLSTNLPNYVPFQRDFGDDSRIDTFIRTKGLVSLKNPLEKMTGSQRDILDPMDEILNHVYEMESLTAKQKVALALVDKVNEGELGDLVKRTENKTSGPGRYVFYVWRNGEKAYYSTEDQGLYHAIAMTNPAANMTDFEKLLTVPASMLRSLTTNSIGFAWKNPNRDTVQAGVYGKGFIPVKSTLDGIVSILKKDDAYVDYLKHGGAQGLASISNAKRKDIKDDVRGNKTHNPAKVLWNVLKRINFLSEQGTRVGQYKAAIKLGYSKDEAAFIQRDLMNFMQGGYSAKRLNAHAVFFNAGMQDLYKLYNAHIHDGAFDTATVRKAITWITIPSMLFWAWNNGDDDRKKIWNEMETWKKNLFWWIIIDKDFSIPIPKPFSLGLLYGSMPERFMDYWLNDDKRTAEGFATTLAAQMLPSALPLYAALFMEFMQNRSLFFDRDIVPVSEQHLDKSMQYGTYTSAWAKWVGKNIPGVSPRMLEHTVYGVTGNLGREVSGVVNDIWRGVSGETRPAKEIFEYFPGSSSFIRNNRTFRISVDRWFDDSKRLDGALDSAKKMREEGYASMTDKQKAVLNAEGQIRGILLMNTARGGIYSLMRQKNDIAESKTMTATEKRDAIDKIDAHIVSMAQLGLKRVKQYDDAVEQMEEMMEARREEKK